MAPKQVVFWSTLAVVVGLDQATKRWVVAALPRRRDEIAIVPHLLSIVHRENPGAAFGMLQDSPHRYAFFAAFTVVVCVLLLLMYRRIDPRDRLLAGALGLVTGGAVGNAIDRAEKRTVTDFVKVYTDHPGVAGWINDHFASFGHPGSSVAEWPTFNVADATLLIGLMLFLVHAISWDDEDSLSGNKEPDVT